MKQQVIAGQSPVAIFVPSYFGGGAERVLLNIANGLLGHGVSVEVIVGVADGPFRSLLAPGVRVVELGASRLVNVLLPLTRHLRHSRARTLISGMDLGNLLALAAVRLSSRKIANVLTVHVDPRAMAVHHPPRGLTRIVHALVRRCYPRAEGVVAVSRGAADGLAAEHGMAREQITVIHNPIVSPRLLEDANGSAGHPWLDQAGPPVILGVGRLVRQKDFETLIHAFALLRTKRPVRLIILGEGEERPALTALIESLGLTDSVALPGFAENPHAWMRRVNVVAMSSTFEGFGNVLVEAMACGTAVVSTDCPSGPAEILDGGRYGPLVPVADPVALATALESLLDRGPQREILMERAKAFSIDYVSGQYLDLIQSLQRS